MRKTTKTKSTCCYPQPDQSVHALQFQISSILFNIILQSTPKFSECSFLHVSVPKTPVKNSSSPYVTHAPPIQSLIRSAGEWNLPQSPKLTLFCEVQEQYFIRHLTSLLHSGHFAGPQAAYRLPLFHSPLSRGPRLLVQRTAVNITFIFPVFN